MDRLPSPSQIRAGRSLLGWSQQQLADASQTSRRTIATFEGGGVVSTETIQSMTTAIAGAGIEFIGVDGSEGVRRTPVG